MNQSTDQTNPALPVPMSDTDLLAEFLRGRLAPPALIKELSRRGRDQFTSDELATTKPLIDESDPLLRRMAKLATTAWTSRTAGGAACRRWTTWVVEGQLGPGIASGEAGVHGIFARHREDLKRDDTKSRERAFNSLRLALLSAHWHAPLDAQELVAAFRTALLPSPLEKRTRDVDRAASAWMLKAASMKTVKDLLASVELWIDAAAAARRSMREVLDERDRAVEEASRQRADNVQLRKDLDDLRAQLETAGGAISALQERVRTLENELVLQRDRFLARVQKQMQGIDTRLRDAEAACTIDPPRVNIALQRLETARQMTQGDQWLSSD